MFLCVGSDVTRVKRMKSLLFGRKLGGTAENFVPCMETCKGFFMHRSVQGNDAVRAVHGLCGEQGEGFALTRIVKTKKEKKKCLMQTN